MLELVRTPTPLPQTVGHYSWLATKSFNDATNTLSIETTTGERYIFDVRTGEIIESILPLQFPTIAPQSSWVLASAFFWAFCSGYTD